MNKKASVNNSPGSRVTLGQHIGRLGLTPDMKPSNFSKGYAFNQMNFAGLIIGLIRLLYIVVSPPAFFQPIDFLVNALPVFGCIVMMVCMAGGARTFTVYFSFLVFPIVFSLISWETHDHGILTYFIPYLVYPFFFLNRTWKIVVSFVYSAVFLMLAFVLTMIHEHAGAAHDRILELVSLAGAMVLSFISLYSIKYQIWHYEKKIRRQKTELEAMNDTISREKEKLKESNHVRDKLFSIISHDLRVPIQGLHLMLSNEAHQEAALAVLAENLPELRAELKKTSQLFDDLLDWSRLQISNNDFVAQKIDISELASKVRETLHHAAFEKDIQVEIIISDNWMYADRDMMEIVLRNLLSNAIKFSPCEGTVVITGLVKQDDYLLGVEDSGAGIEGPAMEKIMEREFYTSPGTCNEKGSGLGLIICSELVEKCGGILSIHSTIGKGTRVSASIPHPPEVPSRN